MKVDYIMLNVLVVNTFTFIRILIIVMLVMVVNIGLGLEFDTLSLQTGIHYPP